MQFKYHALCKQCECYKIQEGRKDKVYSQFHFKMGSKDRHINKQKKNHLHECEHIENHSNNYSNSNYSNNILNYKKKILSIICSNTTNPHIISLK